MRIRDWAGVAGVACGLMMLIVGARLNATEAAAKAEKAAPEKSVTELSAQLESADAKQRYQAVQALARSSGTATDAEARTTALTRALQKQNEDRNVRYEAVRALGELGPAAKSSVPTLIALLSKEDPHMRAWAAKALGGIGTDAAEAGAVPALQAALQDPKPFVRRQAAEALGSMGTAGEAALSALSAAKDGANDEAVRKRAEVAKKRIEEAKAKQAEVEQIEREKQAEKEK